MTTLTIDIDDYYTSGESLTDTMDISINSGVTIVSSGDVDDVGNGYVSDTNFSFASGATTINEINDQSSDWTNVNINRSNNALENITINIGSGVTGLTSGAAYINSKYWWDIVVWDTTGSGSDTISILGQFYLYANDGATDVEKYMQIYAKHI